MTDTTVDADKVSDEQEKAPSQDEPQGANEGGEDQGKPTIEDELARWKSSSRKHEDAKKDAVKRLADLKKELEETQAELGKYKTAEREAAEAERKAKVDAMDSTTKSLFEKMVEKGLSEDDALAVVWNDTASSSDGESSVKAVAPVKVRPNSFDKKPSAENKKHQTREQRLAEIRSNLGR